MIKMSWRLRTAAMFIAMTLLLIMIGSIIGYIFSNVCACVFIMFIFSVSFNMISYIFSKRITLLVNKVKLISYNQEPRLYSIVQKLAIKSDIPIPEVGISNLMMPNAFATGHSKNDAAVVVTRQLLSTLNDDELEGVIAHELSHIKNRDILVMSIASTIASFVSLSTRMIMWASIFNNKDNDIPLAASIIADMTLPLAAVIIQLGVSRNREYLADESGAKLTGKPMSLANALIKIESGCSRSYVYDNPSTSNMWISNPFSGRK